LGQRSSNGKNYAIACPNLTYLWRHSWTAQYNTTAREWS